MNSARAKRLIDNAIRSFDLDLTDVNVLTEAASGAYRFTALLAALAGAKRVLALTRDSHHGTVSEIRRTTEKVAHAWGVQDRIDVLTDRGDPRIGQAEIVTNLGFVRPLDLAFLHRLGPLAVIALMWETWEYRSSDLDLTACRRLGIPVVGTNEHHKTLNTFDYLGPVVLRLLFDLGVEGVHSKIVILGGGPFVRSIAAFLGAICRQVVVLDADRLPGEASTLRHAFCDADALVIAEHRRRDLLLGRGGLLSPRRLAAINPGLAIAHLCGGIDRQAIMDAGLDVQPSAIAPAGSMSVTTAYVGPRPLIDLHAAGLAVGRVMLDARRGGLAGRAAERYCGERCPFADVFVEVHDIQEEKRKP